MSQGAKEAERVLGYFTATLRRTWMPPTYDLYFTGQRIIFVKIGDYVSPGVGAIPSILSDIGQAAENHNIKVRREKYVQMAPQQIADGKDNVGVFYSDVASVMVKGKRFAVEIWFTFARKQKLEWEKVGFNLYRDDLRVAGQLLRSFLASKLNVELQSHKLIELFENALPPPPPP